MACSHLQSMCRLFVCLALVTVCNTRISFKRQGCEVPDPPDHSTYRCHPPLCQEPPDSSMFKADTVVEFFCQPGYVPATMPALAICQGGQWKMLRDVMCKPQGTPRPSALIAAASIPMVIAAAVTFSAFLVTVVACVLLKPRFHFCPCNGGSYEALEDSSRVERVDELDANQSGSSGGGLALPSYEEAIYGHTGAPLPLAGRGPTPLVFSQDTLSHPDLCGPSQSPPGGAPFLGEPPSYQEALVATSAATGNAPAGVARLAREHLPPVVGKKSRP
ncbi:sushi domain-containing protein 6-like [Rhineura floridana]|uniref:sushi domain-containing protein 6-like n=1 Tax=Rhineura floridana TaxID=261503 RepID=UPI002AC82F6F|nr:sushi domain-containing protein 6-like [Rhineura floridana]